MKKLGDLLNDFSVRLHPASTPAGQREEELYLTVERARQEWDAARKFFDSVIDADLIDHAIYAMNAAEKKYLFLLKKARDSGYRVNLALESEEIPQEE